MKSLDKLVLAPKSIVLEVGSTKRGRVWSRNINIRFYTCNVNTLSEQGLLVPTVEFRFIFTRKSYGAEILYIKHCNIYIIYIPLDSYFSTQWVLGEEICIISSPEECLYFTVGSLFSHFMGQSFFFKFEFAFCLSPKLRNGEDFMEI